MKKSIVSKFLYFFILLCLPIYPSYAVDFPNKPNNDNFYVDEANLISSEDRMEINKTIRNLWQTTGIAMIVVTIPSLEVQKAKDITVDTYARMLFDYWGIGSKDNNYGILLLISRDDRHARIELGKSWANRYNSQTDNIMQNIIIPHFKKGEFSAGMVAGVHSLDQMARNVSSSTKVKVEDFLSSYGIPDWAIQILFVLAIVLCVLSIISLFKSGRSGWAWIIIGFILVLLWSILRNIKIGGRGGSGGMFGGGSSSGGGSSGSW